MGIWKGRGGLEGVGGTGFVAAPALNAVEVGNLDGVLFEVGGNGLRGAGLGALDAGKTADRIDVAAA